MPQPCCGRFLCHLAGSLLLGHEVDLVAQYGLRDEMKWFIYKEFKQSYVRARRQDPAWESGTSRASSVIPITTHENFGRKGAPARIGVYK